MHASQFWWAWLLLFRRFCPFLACLQNRKISLRTMDYSPWGSKIESAQKIHASRGLPETHANHF